MNKTAIIGLGILIVVIAIFLIRCSCGNSDDNEPTPEPSVDIEAPADIVAPEVGTPARQIFDLQCQVNLLTVEKQALQEAFDVNSVTLRDTLARQQEYFTLYQKATKEVERLNKIIAITMSELQGTGDDIGIYQDYNEGLRYDIEILKEQLNDLNVKYNTLISRIDKVSDRQDITVSSNLTAEKRTHFYEMWDIWIKTVDGVK